MIWESSYWKSSLGRDASSLLRLIKSGDDGSLSKLERILFVSAYSMRKLSEDKKVTNSLVSSRISVSSYERKAESAPRPWNLHNIDRHFLMDKFSSRDFDIGYFLNQIIHSKILVFSSDDSGYVDGFFVCSEKSFDKEIFHVYFSQYVELMRRFSRNHPRGMRWKVSGGKETIEIV